MKIIQAVSHDGFIATGPNDDMRWTGRTDKNLFKLLTLAASTDPIGVSIRTAETFGFGLKDRRVKILTRNADLTLGKKTRDQYMTLEDFCIRYPTGWVGGGAEIWQKVLELDRTGLVMVSHIIRCRSSALLSGWAEAIPDPVETHLKSDRFKLLDPMQETVFGDIQVYVWEHIKAWAAA